MVLSRATHRRLITLAALVAFVHQLAACPCGCPENNLWLQTIATLFCGASQRPISPAFCSAVAWADVTDSDEHDCHCEARAHYLSGNPSSAVPIESHVDALRIDEFDPSPLSDPDSFCRRLDIGPVDFSAPPVRAQLGVFLI